jgi:hypothetical protein
VEKLIQDVEGSEAEYKALTKSGPSTPDKLYSWRSTLITRLTVLLDSLRCCSSE